MVHGDFLPEHVLVRAGRVAAVIDTAALGYGPRVLDLARVLVWWHAAIATPAERAICVTRQVIDMLAFVIAHHPDDVAMMAERGQTVLAAFRDG